MKQTNIPPREQLIVNAFVADLPEILAGRDPYVPNGSAFVNEPALGPKIECAEDECTNAVFQKGRCQKHFGEWRKRKRGDD